MLRAIPGDLNQFCMQIGKDTFGSLKVDPDLSKDVKEFYANMFTDASMVREQVKKAAVDVLENIDDTVMSQLVVPWNYNDTVEEAQFRKECIDTYTTPLLENKGDESGAKGSRRAMEDMETTEFLKSFDIESSTETITSVLQEHTIVKEYFDQLVPTEVSYLNFWTRYFFRCDPKLIAKQWQANEERIRKSREQNIATLRKVVAPVRSLAKDFKSGVAWDLEDAIRESDYRKFVREVYTAPLTKPNPDSGKCTIKSKIDIAWFESEETRMFLETFNVASKTEEITIILDQHQDSVKVHFETLVPTEVSYAEFWERYFFRCDVDRIARVWKLDDEITRYWRSEKIASWTKTIGMPVSIISSPLRSIHRNLSKKLGKNSETLEAFDELVPLGSTSKQTEPKDLLAQIDCSASKDEVSDAMVQLSESNKKILALRHKLEQTKSRLASAEKRVSGLKDNTSKDATDSVQSSTDEETTESVSDNSSFVESFPACDDSQAYASSDVPQASLQSKFIVANAKKGIVVESSVHSLVEEDLTEFEVEEKKLQSPTSVFGKLSGDTLSLVKLSVGSLWRQEDDLSVESAIQETW